MREDQPVVAYADSLARFAALLADRSRMAMCLALLDGRAWTAGELARCAGIGRSTASEHISVLVDAEVFSEVRQGRHRYVRLAGPEVAQLIEHLGAVVGVADLPRSLRAVRASQQLAAARTCYDHLAGRLGVQLFDAMVQRGLIDTRHGAVLTDAGRDWWADFAGSECLEPTARPLIRTCLDWTERRFHLGGGLGAAMYRELIVREWIEPARQPRAITTTVKGSLGLAALFGLESGSEQRRCGVPGARA